MQDLAQSHRLNCESKPTWVKTLLLLLCCTLLVIALPTVISEAEASRGRAGGRRVYRWVDSDGKVRYSDRIPPDQADLGHSELAPTTGMVEREIPRAKTAEQLARESAEEQERRRQQMIERAQKEEERRLLRRYRDIDAIDREQSAQLERIDAEVNTIEARISTIRNSIADLSQRAADLERKQGTLPTELYTRIDSFETEIEEQNELIEQKREERKKTEAQFQEYREQFAKIMGVSGAANP